MKKSALLIIAGLILVALAAPVFAEGAAPEAAAAGPSAKAYLFIAAGFSMAIASAICGLAQGKAIAAACEGAARNPGMADKLQLMMIIGLAFIESLALYVMLIVFVKMNA